MKDKNMTFRSFFIIIITLVISVFLINYAIDVFQKQSLECTNSYVKFSETSWDSDLQVYKGYERYCTNIQSKLLNFYTKEEMSPRIIKNEVDYKLTEEQYRELLHYLVNKEKIFSKVEDLGTFSGVTYQLEVCYKNQTKHVYLTDYEIVSNLLKLMSHEE